MSRSRTSNSSARKLNGLKPFGDAVGVDIPILLRERGPSRTGSNAEEAI
jgi:hypothetical protein